MRKIHGAQELTGQASAPLMRQRCRGHEGLPKKKKVERGAGSACRVPRNQRSHKHNAQRATARTEKMSHVDGDQKKKD